MKRYNSFIELLEDQDKNSTALYYFDKNVKSSVTYSELLNLIKNYPIPDGNVIGILAKKDLQTIVSIFALAGKKQIVLLNPDDDIEILKHHVEFTDVETIVGNIDRIDELNDCLKPDKSIATKDIIFFTSGTVSPSRAVVLTEQTLCNATYNGGYLLPLNKNDNLLSIIPFSHAYGFVCSLLWPLSFGAAVSLSRGRTYIFYDFNDFKPTVTTLVPQIAAFMVSKQIFNPELKLVLIGAGDCSIEVLQAIRSLGIKVSFGYGLTETSSGVALSLDEDFKGMTLCPDINIEISKDGVIVISSETTLMKGYYKDPEWTQKKLSNNKFRTSDIGKIENGLLYIIARKKDILVLSDGKKILIPEYEAKLQQIIGITADFTIMKDSEGKLVLYIFIGENIDKKIELFNKTIPEDMRITRIIYSRTKLPRTKTNKVKKYLIKV
ncbi:MAG: acyl--CoA ligase [Clostridia bacterium]|nr:acyl--CoA ligase [Clostridia bacterium]